MKKLVIGMLVVGLLGLLTVSAIGAEHTYVYATIDDYYNLNVTDDTIEFGLLGAEIGGNPGTWVEATDRATATIAANVDLLVVFGNGPDLNYTNGTTTHYLETELATWIQGGLVRWDTIEFDLTVGKWGGWGYCGTAAGSADGGAGDTGVLVLQGGSTYDIVMKAQVFRQGIKDYRGSYTTQNTMTISAYLW